jgi:hypothetical protein
MTTTGGGNSSNKISGKVLSTGKKNGHNNDNSSVDTDRNNNHNTSTSNKMELSGSIDLKNI